MSIIGESLRRRIPDITVRAWSIAQFEGQLGSVEISGFEVHIIEKHVGKEAPLFKHKQDRYEYRVKFVGRSEGLLKLRKNIVFTEEYNDGVIEVRSGASEDEVKRGREFMKAAHLVTAANRLLRLRPNIGEDITPEFIVDGRKLTEEELEAYRTMSRDNRIMPLTVRELFF